MQSVASIILLIASLIPSLIAEQHISSYGRLPLNRDVIPAHQIQSEGDAINLSQQLVIQPVRQPGISKHDVDAASALVVDQASGRILYSKERDVIRPIASITKLMTAIVAINLIDDLDSEVTISEEDRARGGRYYVYNGDRVTVRDLFYLSLVSSANDAALALARSTGLSRNDFVSQMNAHARELGLLRTTFTEPTGLDAGNISTANEVAILLQVALDHPFLQQLLRVDEYSFTPLNGIKSRKITSTNKLLGNSSYTIIGGKTGFINESGYNFVVQVKGNEGETLSAVILGTRSDLERFAEATELFDWAEKAWNFPSIE